MRTINITLLLLLILL